MQNFGKIKNTFNKILVEGIADKSDAKKAIFSKFVKTIKESNILRTQFNLYYDIEKKAEPNQLKSSEYVRESISLMSKFTKKEILAENQKLLKLLSENNIEVSNEPYANEELHENIGHLIFTKRNSNSMNTIVESLEKVIGYVQKNIIVEKAAPEFSPNSWMAERIIEKYNEGYDSLEEGDKALVKSILNADADGRAKIFKTLTTECISLINEKLGESNSVEEKEALLNVKENLLTLEYTNSDYVKDFGRIIELKKALNG